MNRSLRRLVHGEEEAQREKRQRLQQLLKQRIAEAATAAANAASSLSTAAATAAPGGGPSTLVADEKPAVEDEDDEEEEVIEQQKLLASGSAYWRCMEDSQQAVCLAMNRRQTLFAIGEKDGRISIWDNTTIRVITKELDPTAIVLPSVEAADAVPAMLQEEKEQQQEDGERATKRLKRDGLERVEMERQTSVEDADGSTGGESATNEDDASVDDGNNDAESVTKDEDDDASVDEDHEVEEEDEVEDVAMDGDESASVEDAMSVDGDLGGEEAAAATVTPESVGSTQVPRKLSESGQASGVSVEELKIAKTSLKHVLSIAWSCDSRLLFAGCEEKSNRRGRLCVWDADSAWLLATFSFEGAVNSVCAHPANPELVIVCSYNSLPVLLNVRTREQTEIAVPVANSTLTVTPPSNSRQPSLVVCCRYGASGRFIYCATSKSTVSVLDSETLEVLDFKLLSILIQFVDLSVNHQETALVFTSSKGIHEFTIAEDCGEAGSARKSLQETRLYSTGAVRAPWALCCFSSDGDYVVGMPIVRHRHVGESGLYTWHRVTGRVQHNLGVKDGVNSVAWDLRRDAIVAVSCVGAIYVLEEEFKTDWPGTMYPAGFRLVTDNELDMEAIERELGEHEEHVDPVVDQSEDDKMQTIDVFTVVTEEDDFEKVFPPVSQELRNISSVPITQHVKRHSQHDFHIERHFGLGQSVFEPLKSAIKKPSSSSSSKKKKSVPSETTAASKVSSGKNKSKSRSGSSKKRRR